MDDGRKLQIMMGGEFYYRTISFDDGSFYSTNPRNAKKKEKINFIAVEFIQEEKLRFSRLLSQEQQKWHFLNKVKKKSTKKSYQF